MRTSAVLTRTQTLSPEEGAEVAEISIMHFFKQNACHIIVTAGNSLAFGGFWGNLIFNYEIPA
jgi:hypothetical protein